MSMKVEITFFFLLVTNNQCKMSSHLQHMYSMPGSILTVRYVQIVIITHKRQKNVTLKKRQTSKNDIFSFYRIGRCGGGVAAGRTSHEFTNIINADEFADET